MRVITTRELRNNTKAVFERAKTERIAVKRGDQLVNLVTADDALMDFVDGTWAREFFAIPAEFRVNPFDVSPSGDTFFADKRNLDKIEEASKGPFFTLTEEEERKLFEID
jgi:sugar/nucleoside kinase (ribokinase family)